MRRFATVGQSLAAGAVSLAVVLVASTTWAQTPLGGWVLEGGIEAGVRLLPDRPSKTESGKFEEYRDLEQGVFLESLGLRLRTADEKVFFELGGRQWGYKDQEYSFNVGRLGLWEGGFEWNQIPHTFSTSARFLGQEGPDGVFTLPTPRPSLNRHNAAPEPDDVSLLRKDAHFSFKLTPTPWIDITAEYTRIRKDGERPFGMAMGSPGNNHYEILEPIEQTTHDFRIKAVVAREWWQLQISYGFSAFRNGLDAVVADNPCFGLPGTPTGLAPAFQCGSDANGAPARGRTALTPDNTAHTMSIAGGVNLPWWYTRLTGNFTYSLRFQDQDFLPQTINAALNSPLLTLPQKSLDGTVGITTVNFNATSRPLPPLTLSLRYRLFDFNDMTDELIFPANVVNDRSVTVEAQRAARFEQTRHNLDVDARWRFGAIAAAGLGGGWEGLRRSQNREIEKSDEIFLKATIDTTPWEWLLARLTYRPSFRRIGDYNPAAQLIRTTVEDVTADAIAAFQSPLLRKLDESDRDRQRVDLMVQLMPMDTLTASLTGSFRNDNYYNSVLGLQDATSWTAGFDVTWSPTDRISFTGGYNHEWNLQRQTSRSRPVSGTTTFDFADFNWTTTTTDRIEAFYLGMRGALIPQVLDLLFGARYEFARSEVANRNPVTPKSGTAAQNLTATAVHWPDTDDSMFRFDIAARYHFWKNWTATVGYALEIFQKTNWQTDQLNPFIPGVSSIWEGNNFRDYTAHIISLTLGYRF